MTTRSGPRSLPYPSSRRLTFDVGRIGRSKHRVHALLEVDVDDARRRVKALRREGQPASFTAWVVKVIAESVARHPEVAAFNQPGRNRVVVFPHVDVALVIEREVDGVRVPLPYVIRGADRATLEAIRTAIDAARSQPVRDEGDLVLGQARDPLGMRLFVRLPQWARLALMRATVFASPRRTMAAMGNVMVTTVGMVGRAQGWIVPVSMHPLCLALGSLGRRPAVVDGEVVARTVLHVTVLVDHDVVDGIPAARFVADLVKRMEGAQGL